MSTRIIYGYAIKGYREVEETLTRIAERINGTAYGTVENVEGFILDPNENPISWSDTHFSPFSEIPVIEKVYDEIRHENILIIYPKPLEFVATTGVVTVDVNSNRKAWGVAELFGALMSFEDLPTYHIVTV